MKAENIKKFILPPGPILILTLIGLLLLSAVLYYRAVKIQRFLEPALAISEPRLRFTQSMNNLLSKEFGTIKVNGIRFKTGSIYVEQSLLFDSARSEKGTETEILRKLSHVFLVALSNPDMRNNISLVLVSARQPLGPDTALNREIRTLMQERSLMILNALYRAEPELEKNFGMYFAATTMPVNAAGEEPNWVEFRIVPTERLHIEVLQRLMKYMQ